MWHTLGHRQASRSRLRNVRDLAEPQEFVSSKWLLHNQKRQERQERRERQERLPKQDLDHKSAKDGWPAVSPPGGFQWNPIKNDVKKALPKKRHFKTT